jgi:hypothetical protein
MLQAIERCGIRCDGALSELTAALSKRVTALQRAGALLAPVVAGLEAETLGKYRVASRFKAWGEPEYEFVVFGRGLADK